MSRSSDDGVPLAVMFIGLVVCIVIACIFAFHVGASWKPPSKAPCYQINFDDDMTGGYSYVSAPDGHQMARFKEPQDAIDFVNRLDGEVCK